MTQAFPGKRTSSTHKVPTKTLADVLASDPTSVFLSALRHSHPDALKALAVWCKKQDSLEKPRDSGSPKKHDQSSVIQAMEGLKRMGSATANRLSAIKKEDENLVELETLTQPINISALDETADYPTIAFAHMEASAARQFIEDKAQEAAAAQSAALDETSEYAAIPFTAKEAFGGEDSLRASILREAAQAESKKVEQAKLEEEQKKEEKRRLQEERQKLVEDQKLLEEKQQLRAAEQAKMDAEEQAALEANKQEKERQEKLETSRLLKEKEEQAVRESIEERKRLDAENLETERVLAEEKKRSEQKKNLEKRKLEEQQKLDQERLEAKRKLERETPEERKKREDAEKLEAKKKRQEREELEAKQKLEELERIQAKQRLEDEARKESERKREEEEMAFARKKRAERELAEAEKKREEQEKRDALKKLEEKQKQEAKAKREEEEALEAKRRLEAEIEESRRKVDQEVVPEAVVVTDFSLPVDETLEPFDSEQLSVRTHDSMDFSVLEDSSQRNKSLDGKPSIAPAILAAFDIPIPPDEILEGGKDSDATIADDISFAPVQKLTDSQANIPLRPSAKGQKKPQRIEAASADLTQLGDQKDVTEIPRPLSSEGLLEDDLQEEYQGVYEQITQRGGVFDAKSRDPFSGNSEKKIRTTYIGLKAVTKEEAEAAQADSVQKQKQTAEVRALTTPVAPVDKVAQVQAAAEAVKKVDKTKFFAGIALVLIALLGFVVFNFSRAESQFQTGKTLFAAEKYPESIKALSETVNLNPFSAHAYLLRGQAFNKQGNSDASIDDFSKALSINPNDLVSLDYRASAYIKASKFEPALADYKTIFRLAPEDKKLYRYTNAGFAARSLKNYDDAVNYFGMALGLDPKDLNANLGKIGALMDLNKPAEALEQIEKVLTFDPSNVDVHLTKGWCYEKLKQDDKALAEFGYVLQHDPKNARAALAKGNLLSRTGKVEEAIRYYNDACKFDPSLIEARTARAWITMHKAPKTALADLKAITTSGALSESEAHWKSRGDLEFRAGHFKQSLSSYKTAMKHADKPDVGILLGVAGASNAVGDPKSAIEYCNQAIALEPTNPMAFITRGFAHQLNKNNISAISDYTQAHILKPDMPEPLLFRAKHYISTKAFIAAQGDLTKLLLGSPKNAEAQKLLALVKTKIPKSVALASESAVSRKYAGVPFEQLLSKGYEAMTKGKTDVAVAMLTEAVNKNPSDVNARRYLCHSLVREDPKACVREFEALRNASVFNEQDDACYKQALSYAACGSNAEADAIGKALGTIAKNPNNPTACLKLASIYAAAGMMSKANSFIQMGLAGASSPTDKKRLDELYQRINKPQNSIDQYRQDVGG